jgi:hypothetical protein
VERKEEQADTKRHAGRQHPLSVNNARCEAPNCSSQVKAGEQERIQKEQLESVLRGSHESKAKEQGKCGRKAMKSDCKQRGIGETSVTSKTLIPVQTPMRTLCSGLYVWRFAVLFLLQLNRLRRKKNCL